MVKLRMKRMGRRNHCFYRLCAMDARTRRNGRAIEELGIYDPKNKDAAKQVLLNTERIAYWLSVGAQPSDTALRLVAKAGVEVPKHITHRRELLAKQRTMQTKKKADIAAQKAAKKAEIEAQVAAAKAAKAASPAAEGEKKE